MKITFIFLFSFFLLGSEISKVNLNPLTPLENHLQNLYSKIAPKVVFIKSGEVFGTGFLVSKSGIIITNSHVINNKNSILVVLFSGEKFPAKLIKRGKSHTDVALIKIKSKNKKFPYLTIKNTISKKIGSWVGTIGHGSGTAWSFNTGIISNIYVKKSENVVFQTQIPINPGSSGGPVFDKDGNVLGIITAAIHGSDGINFAIDILKASEALEIKPESINYTFKIISENIPMVFIDKKTIKINHNTTIKLKKGKHLLKYLSGGKLKTIEINIPEMKSVKID